jgi:hypothetical protein
MSGGDFAILWRRQPDQLLSDVIGSRSSCTTLTFTNCCIDVPLSGRQLLSSQKLKLQKIDAHV